MVWLIPRVTFNWEKMVVMGSLTMAIASFLLRAVSAALTTARTECSSDTAPLHQLQAMENSSDQAVGGVARGSPSTQLLSSMKISVCMHLKQMYPNLHILWNTNAIFTIFCLIFLWDLLIC